MWLFIIGFIVTVDIGTIVLWIWTTDSIRKILCALEAYILFRWVPTKWIRDRVSRPIRLDPDIQGYHYAQLYSDRGHGYRPRFAPALALLYKGLYNRCDWDQLWQWWLSGYLPWEPSRQWVFQIVLSRDNPSHHQYDPPQAPITKTRKQLQQARRCTTHLIVYLDHPLCNHQQCHLSGWGRVTIRHLTHKTFIIKRQSDLDSLSLHALLADCPFEEWMTTM